MVRPLSSVVSAVAIILLSCHSQTTTRAFSPPDSSISRSRLNRDRRNELPSPILQYGRIKSSPRDGGAVGTRSVVVCHAGISPVAAGTSVARRFFSYGATAFMTNWKSNCLIPLVAGFVGWLTNYLAVQMIFFPIRWRGLPIYKVEGEPLGLLGWQGIIPAKTLKMSEAMVNTTINELLTMEEIIQRLDPDRVADILLPSSGKIVQPFVDELLADKPEAIAKFASNYVTDTNRSLQQRVARNFLRDLTLDVQQNIGKVCNLRNCVVNEMMSDRSLLGKLFRISGRDELVFLVDSGLLFGFFLGIIQLFVTLYVKWPWTLSIGGLLVGLATNWLALKWIFEPVNPFKIGPIVLQGLFLRRQDEVSADFSKFFAKEVLNSSELWKSMLTDPSTLPEWEKLVAKRFATFTMDVTLGAVDLEGDQYKEKLNAASAKLCSVLYDYLDDLHEYVDEALGIEESLRERMMAMSSSQFERVLHPIFEEDEMTLILAGGGLGFIAGYIQQLLTTGALALPRFTIKRSPIALAGYVFSMLAVSLALKPTQRLVSWMMVIDRMKEKLRRGTKKTYRYLNRGRRDHGDGNVVS